MNSPFRKLHVFVLASLAAFAIPSAPAALVLQYNFDNGASPTPDSASNPADGTVIGAGTFVTNTPSGSGYAFNTGGSSYITTGTSANPDAGTDPAKLDDLTSFTITLWVNFQGAVAANDRLVSDWNVAINAGFDLRFNTADGQLGLAVNSPTAHSGTARLDVTQNVWRFVAVTYDGTTNSANVRFYSADTGTPVGQLGLTASLAAGAIQPNTVDFQVAGTAASPSDRTPNAFFDDVRIYDQVLDQAALEQIRIEGIPEPSAVLLASLAGVVAIARRGRAGR